MTLANMIRELAEAAASARRKEEAKQGYFNWFWGKKENKVRKSHFICFKNSASS